ncbi:MAG: alkaline phosphatase D family protein [Deltaproteobacteria bacterium]|nr:alkaline phosphatase D family protein [Deltaproteobacteria bacterium]
MLTRRGFLAGSVASVAAACGKAPTVTGKRPVVTHGVQSGDVGSGRGNVWARCDEPARMVVEWDTTPSFARARRVTGPLVSPEGDLTGAVTLDGLPDGQTIAYRVRFEREAARGASEWVAGRFATPRADRVRVAWTGDTCGQGYGRNPEFGGLLGFKALREAQPSLFINSGDLIYGDNPILPEQKLDDGRIWKNISNERVARVAQSLDDFRARFAYNFEDEHLRAFAADVSVIAQWDDHETHNNWYPDQRLDDDRYTERDINRLAARALRATYEWYPITRGPVNRVIRHGPLLDVVVVDCRSFRSANDANLDHPRAMLGGPQATWLVETLAASTARWKIVACDQPFTMQVTDGPNAQEGWANTDHGPPRGREVELARILAGLHAQRTRNVVWVTADVHFAAAHHCDPTRARFADFDPFWQFIAGPIHAGTFRTDPLDATFGPEVKFEWMPDEGKGNLPPSDGLQSFGTIDVAKDALAVSIVGIDGKSRYRVEVPWTA